MQSFNRHCCSKRRKSSQCLRMKYPIAYCRWEVSFIRNGCLKLLQIVCMWENNSFFILLWFYLLFGTLCLRCFWINSIFFWFKRSFCVLVRSVHYSSVSTRKTETDSGFCSFIIIVSFYFFLSCSKCIIYTLTNYHSQLLLHVLMHIFARIWPQS